MDDGKITLDRETFKALAVDSRVKILRVLDERQHTLTDLAQELGMAPSTIKEHLDTLVAAGLIKQVDKGMKWKYYRLTSKGKELLNPYEKKVWIVLATSLLALGVTAYTIYLRLRGLGKAKYADDYIPLPVSSSGEKAVQGASGEFLKSMPHAGATEATVNATGGMLLNDDKGAAMTTSFNVSMDCLTEGCRNLALNAAAEAEKNLSDVSATVSGAMDSVSSTIAGAAGDAASKAPVFSDTHTRILESGAQLPYAEIALFAIFSLLAGLCIGYLIKKKNRI